MARPPLPLGTWGNINTLETADGRVRAYANYRGYDGRTRKVERTGVSKPKAIRKLRGDLKDMAGVADRQALDANSRLADAARLWLAQMQGEVADTTMAGYRRRVNNHIVPAIGQLLVRECTATRLNTFMKDLRTQGLSANYRRSVRNILSGCLNIVVLEKVLDHNPVRSMQRIRGGNTRAKVTFSAEQLADFLDKLDADRHATRADLPDFMRFLFGTGVRYGEALAVRWRDLNLTDRTITMGTQKVPPRSVWINGNLVEITGQGVVRHDGKTDAAVRVVGLPEFLNALLLVRRDSDAIDDDPVFATAAFGWRAPTNVQRAVRNFRDRNGFPEFTTHASRRTVATLLDHSGQSARQIADHVGHTDPSMTQKVYMGRGLANPEAADVLDKAHRKDTN